MTKDVIELAREAGLVERDHDNIEVVTLDDLPKLAALLAARERERCMAACQEVVQQFGGIASGPFVTDFGKHTHQAMAAGASNCIAAIRALNTEGEGNAV